MTDTTKTLTNPQKPTLKMIPQSSYGSADYVSEALVVRRCVWGGFLAQAIADAQGEPYLILLAAVQWRGAQPRLVLDRKHPGFADWQMILSHSGPINTLIRFVGAADAESNLGDQWITHGPSSIL